MIAFLASLLIARNPRMTAQYARFLVKLGMVAVGIVLLVGAVAWFHAREKADDNANQEIGAAVQREADLRETIERTETANEARDDIGRRGAAGDRLRYDQCLRTARTPANCERFLHR